MTFCLNLEPELETSVTEPKSRLIEDIDRSASLEREVKDVKPWKTRSQASRVAGLGAANLPRTSHRPEGSGETFG
jgi:hypothetical protein